MKNLKTYENYYKDYFIENMPREIEFPDVWKKSVEIATKNNNNTFGAIRAIYNNMEKNIPPHTEENSQYKYYKKKFDLISWGNNYSKKKFILSLLNQLKTKHKLTEKQWYHLKKALK